MKLSSKTESSGTKQQDSQKQAGANPQKEPKRNKKKTKEIQPRLLGTEVGFQKHEGIKHEEQHRDGGNKTDKLKKIGEKTRTSIHRRPIGDR